MSAIEDLITELSRLPTIGRKSALRLTYHLLRQPADQSRRLAQALVALVERVRPCEQCFNLTEEPRCAICRDPRRDDSLVCVVEEPSDIHVIERSGTFRGRYHVLHGRLSPLDGVGPEALTVEKLLNRVREGAVREVILATNPDVEGEATALYVRRALEPSGVRVTRIARGVPMGGSLEFMDELTVGEALTARREI